MASGSDFLGDFFGKKLEQAKSPKIVAFLKGIVRLLATYSHPKKI